MLITLCYSVLTWIQSRQRHEISTWVEDCCVKEKASLVYLRDDLLTGCSSRNCSSAGRSRSCSRERDNSAGVSRSESSHSNFSTPRKELTGREGLSKIFYGSSNSLRQTTDLCYNSGSLKWQRLLWEEDKSKVIALYPLQIVDLRDWTAFIGTHILDLYKDFEPENPEEVRKFYILLEAEPGVVQRELYRKFCHFGKITAWKCGVELALILLSDINQLVDLMHIFRLGPIILEGGWRVFRLTTVVCEGTIGTLISRPEVLSDSNTTLAPGDLQRLSAGVFENRETPSSTPKASLSKDTSKHDIATIQECSPEEPEDDILKKLPNWYERSPKKKSIATLSSAERQSLGRKRVGSFCSGTTLNSSKSSSLASLLLCSKSMSVDDDDRTSRVNPLSPTSSTVSSTPTIKAKTKSRQSFENLVGSPPLTQESSSLVQSPQGESLPSIPDGVLPIKSLSAFSSPKKSLSASYTPTAMIKRTPKRLGKPPNILVLCEESKKRGEIAGILKAILATDRYAIYDIRWDQLAVGGWSDQTALLVLCGKIPDESHVPVLLQFLGDGGRLFAWNCDTTPFGPEAAVESSTAVDDRSIIGGKREARKCVVSYGTSQTSSVYVSAVLWTPSKDGTSLPEKFPRILETSDSEGYSRPLTASVFAKITGSNEPAIMVLDGGSLGGKAVLSRVYFEDAKNEESSLALLSVLLSQNLGIDCTRIKAPEYTSGYLLGDHLKIKEFLGSIPSVIQQSMLTVEFIPIGAQGSKPSHERFPVKTLECPQNFSTLDYFNNLETKELGRLVIYTDVITSVLNVFAGHTLRHGLTVIAGRQTAGKGRGKNVWLSPAGAACFAVQINLPMSSQLGRRLPLIQHMAALSIVLAVPNHKEQKLRVKWPNDIYIDTVKIGGVLVETRLDGQTAVVMIGTGVNVCNEHPTISLNSVLKDGEKLTCESLVAKSLSELEKLLDSIESGKLNDVINLYTDNWLHNDEDGDGGGLVVNVEVSAGNYAECRISGVDEYGFLRVTDINSGRVFSVQPDGNSFDIANKLIAIKN